MNAITTKYIPATDYRPSRIKATAGNGQTITIGYPHEYSGCDVHAQAALALCRKNGWTSDEYRETHLIGGSTKDGYVFVFALNPENCYDIYPLPTKE